MYDKVKLWLGSDAMEGGVSSLASYLSEGKEQTDLATGEINVFGRLERLKVSMFPNGVSIVGSLSKYLYPNNIYSLDRHSTKEAVEKMSDALHTDMSKADVTGLEFGTVFPLSHKVEDYLQRLGFAPRLQRERWQDGTLYYKPRSNQPPKMLAFYDKAAQCRQMGVKLPPGFDGMNLLKYELRLNGHLPRQLSVPEIKASTLSERAFYHSLLQRWEDTYFSISKQTQLKTNVMSKIKTPTDAFEVLVARLMAESNKDAISGFVGELKAQKVFNNRSDYTRLKNKIMAVASKAGVVETDELIRELDDAVKNQGAYQ